MLILRRKKSESILIGDNIRITVVECANDGVRLAIDAPKNISILREELSRAEQENKESIAPGYNKIADLQSALLGRMKAVPANLSANQKDPNSADKKNDPNHADDQKDTEH